MSSAGADSGGAAAESGEPPAKRLRATPEAKGGGGGGGGPLRGLARILLSRESIGKLAAIEELADDALACAAANGIVMYKQPAAKAHATAVPVTLLPTPVDAGLYAEAVEMAPIFHELMDRVACDLDWLREVLQDTAKLDDICGGLLEICGRVYGPGGKDYSKDFRLHVMRNDFMLDTAAAARGSFAMKQIELNMIAASFSTHAQDLTEVHRYLLTKYAHRLDASLTPAAVLAALRGGALPVSNAADEIAAALAEAHAAYESRWPQQLGDCGGGGATPRAVLFVTEVTESNELDHRKLELALFRGHGIISIRRSLAQLSAAGVAASAPSLPPRSAEATKRQPLLVDGHEVTVAYFRTGYWPGNYEPRAACWAAREAVEASDAVKCPSVPAQLAGMKKVQQLLAEPALLRRFLPEPGQAERLQRSFARLGDPRGGSAHADGCVAGALAEPAAWVLKPQVEGSGELLFDDDIPRVLRSKAKAELAEYILMERVWPPVTPSVVCRMEPGCRAEVCVRDSVAELGVFGTFTADGSCVLRNKAVGHLLRSKARSTSQGGVFVGNAVVDAPLLLPPDAFWPAAAA